MKKSSSQLLVEDFIKTIEEIRLYLLLVNAVKDYSNDDSYDSLNVDPKDCVAEALAIEYELKPRHYSCDFRTPKEVEIIRDTIEGYKIEVVECFGGKDGDGERYWLVFKYKDRYVRLPGHYDSQNGTELYWDYVKEVKPAPAIKYVDVE